MKIPFGFLPGHWGLKGSTREIARINYESKNDYERELAIAKYLNESPRTILEIEFKYKKITQTEFEDAAIELIQDPYLKQKETLIVLKNRGEIEEFEFDKEIATLNQTPWFHMDVDYVNGEVQIDFKWNSFYIDMLKSNGYDGENDQEIIDSYINDFGHRLSNEYSEF